MTWTIGGLTPAVVILDNVVMALTAGIPVGLLMCRHFPQVSIPDVLARHIAKVAHEQDRDHSESTPTSTRGAG